MKRISIAIVSVAAVAAVAAAAQALAPRTAPPALAEQDVRVVAVVPFTLEAPAVHTFRAEAPTYASGDLVVLESNGATLVPTDLPCRVPMRGAEVLQQVNRGSSGVVVCVAPACDDASGDFRLGPYFLSAPMTPEQVDRAYAANELANARARGQVRLTESDLTSLSAAPVVLPDENELYKLAADLIEAYVPDEQDTVRGLRGY
ncbi:MAG: hypothetical protein R3F34_13570 [Planctomycetota bacterium]